MATLHNLFFLTLNQVQGVLRPKLRMLMNCVRGFFVCCKNQQDQEGRALHFSLFILNAMIPNLGHSRWAIPLSKITLYFYSSCVFCLTNSPALYRFGLSGTSSVASMMISINFNSSWLKFCFLSLFLFAVCKQSMKIFTSRTIVAHRLLRLLRWWSGKIRECESLLCWTLIHQESAWIFFL